MTIEQQREYINVHRVMTYAAKQLRADLRTFQFQLLTAQLMLQIKDMIDTRVRDLESQLGMPPGLKCDVVRDPDNPNGVIVHFNIPTKTAGDINEDFFWDAGGS